MFSPEAFQLSLFRIMLDCFRAGCLIKGRPSAKSALHKPVIAGTRLGPYEIVSPLGAGGIGEVYRARDTRLGREVAVKVLPASFSQDADRLRRFEQEARAASALNHPNILTIYDIGTHEGAPYLVSESGRHSRRARRVPEANRLSARPAHFGHSASYLVSSRESGRLAKPGRRQSPRHVPTARAAAIHG